MLEQRCNFYREIELANVIIEDLIVRKFTEIKNNNDKTVVKKYLAELEELKLLSNNLLDKKIRRKIFDLSNIDWNM
ncbi:MAG: hypothetical protein PHF21_00095 [Bacilli bacterium]|nr:hypothetical protein [Bacilli bacterium]